MTSVQGSGFFIRNSTDADVSKYALLVRNKEWLKNTGFKENEFDNDSQIESFLRKKNDDDVRWLVFDERKGFVGFIHFNAFFDKYVVAIGGLIPECLNSGLGVIYFAKCIDLYYKLGGCRIIHSHVYQRNLRSCKMNLALGFKLLEIRQFGKLKFDVYETNAESFYNSLIVKRFLK